MAIHVAILHRPYIRRILAGEKTMESRLTRRPLAPFRQIEPGERIFLKCASGPFQATALAAAVEFLADPSPADLAQLARRHQSAIAAPPEYFQAKAASRYVSLITLAAVEPLPVGPALAPSFGLAWFVLPERLSPLRDIELTAGGISNSYVIIPRVLGLIPAACYACGPDQRGRLITLLLPDGREVQTDLLPGGRLRWRGWGGLFRRHGLGPGHRLRFVRVGQRRYCVSVPGR